MIAQVIFSADRERANLAVENCLFMSDIQMPFKIFLVEVALLAEVAQMISISVVQLHVILELCVVYESF